MNARSQPRLAVALLLGSLVLAGPAWPQSSSPPPSANPQAGPRTSQLQGTARIDRNNNVVGAVVVARRADEPSRAWITSTDEAGTFRFDSLPEGVYDVTFERQGFTTVTKSAVTVKPPFRAMVEITMLRTAESREPPAPGGSAPSGAQVELRGHVLDRDGKPVPEARVRLVQARGAADPRSTESDASGAFSFSGVAGGPWRLEATGVGFLPLGAELDLATDGVAELRLVRQPASYEPTALELLPEERPIPPPGLLDEPGAPKPVEPSAARAN